MTTSTPRGTTSGKADRKPTRKPARKLRTHRKPTGPLVKGGQPTHTPPPPPKLQ
ncbi:MAG: hypothetical protein IV094_09210 [Vitreoscilla sp.]|nr:hypothetical protein [Vitreoscilla sp.]